MVTKTYETDEYILHYEVQDNKVSCDFIDHEGKTHHINHLWFYDPDLSCSISGEERSQSAIVRWFCENRESLLKTRVDKSALKIFFGESDLSDPLGWWLRNWVHTGAPTPYFERDMVEQSFILLGDGPRVKTEYVLQELLTKGYIYTRQINTTPRTGSMSTNLWSKKLNYSYKMDPDQAKFFRKLAKDNPYTPMYGLELEVSTKLSTQEIYKIVTEVEPVQEPFFIHKDDASVSGKHPYLVELVTVPCSFRYLKRAWTIFFEKVTKLCEAKGLKVDDVFDTSVTLSNGLHIHVGRGSFFNDFHERRFKTAFNSFDKPTLDLFQKVSGRPKMYTSNRYCAPDPEYSGLTLAKRLKLKKSQSRYVAHNYNSGPTIEVRLFQGIFDLKHILKCIEFTDAMVTFTQDLPLSAFGLHFKSRLLDYISKNKTYKHLKEVF